MVHRSILKNLLLISIMYYKKRFQVIYKPTPMLLLLTISNPVLHLPSPKHQSKEASNPQCSSVTEEKKEKSTPRKVSSSNHRDIFE